MFAHQSTLILPRWLSVKEKPPWEGTISCTMTQSPLVYSRYLHPLVTTSRVPDGSEGTSETVGRTVVGRVVVVVLIGARG